MDMDFPADKLFHFFDRIQTTSYTLVTFYVEYDTWTSLMWFADFNIFVDIF